MTERLTLCFFNSSIFVKTVEIDLYGHKAQAYIVLDPERKAKEIKELAFGYCTDKEERDKVKDSLVLKVVWHHGVSQL